MKSLLTLCGLVFFSVSLFAQGLTFSEDIAEILFDNCTSCHRQGGVAPFAIETYQDAYLMRNSIAWATNIGEMPPYPADVSYQHYADERVLSQTEIDMINDWVNDGAPEGDPTLTPDVPTFPDEGTLANPDLQVRMPSYVSSADLSDDYICFVVPSGLTQGRVIKAIEVIPGNREIVHHALIYIDNSGSLNPGPIFNCGSPPGGKLITGYTPGANPTIFPETSPPMGITMNANSNVIIAMHYPSGSAGQMDSTAVNFYFHPAGTLNHREIEAEPIVSDWNFCVPANDSLVINKAIPGILLQQDYSILSVFPHMHLLGKSWEVYSVSPQGDTLPMIRIPDWDFEWQGFYFFRNVQRLPALSTLYARAVYDNTSANPHNPNSPPQDICAGLNTSDEMFLVYFHFLAYQAGDELITQGGLSTSLEPEQNLLVKAWPNPMTDRLQIGFSLSAPSKVSLRLYNQQGQLVSKTEKSYLSIGPQQIILENMDKIPAGIYHYQLVSDLGNASGKIQKR
ncbi:MAG: T9SS type A sorting domain-containing protein [Bacteroidota bacterium]